MKEYNCKNLNNGCNNADHGVAFELAETAPKTCPECGSGPIVELKSTGMPPWLLVLGGLVIVGGVAFGTWRLLHRVPPPVPPGNSASSTTTSTAPLPSPSSTPPKPITPPPACDWSAADPATVAAVLPQFQKGLAQAKAGRNREAIVTLGEVQQQAKGLLGVELNIGVAELALKNWSAADAAFAEETKVITCLNGTTPETRNKLAGELGISAEGDPIGDRLKVSEQLLHYNLACLRAAQDSPKPELAMQELDLATKIAPLRKSDLERAKLLNSLRSRRDYQELLANPDRVVK